MCGLRLILELFAHPLELVGHVGGRGDVVAQFELIVDGRLDVGVLAVAVGRQGRFRTASTMVWPSTVMRSVYAPGPAMGPTSACAESPVRDGARVLILEARLFPDVRIFGRAWCVARPDAAGDSACPTRRG